jgi:hypothetical protein
MVMSSSAGVTLVQAAPAASSTRGQATDEPVYRTTSGTARLDPRGPATETVQHFTAEVDGASVMLPTNAIVA